MMEFLQTGPSQASRALLLAHGAGAPMDSPFMTTMAELIAGHGISVLRFEFSYMAERRSQGRKRPPPPVARLLPEFTAAARQARSRLPDETRLAIGGKSMGGRIASMVADEVFDAGSADALVCLGYPFHPPGRPDTLRTAHLAGLRSPTLIAQGTRDPLGSRAEVEAMPAFSPSIRFAWIADGDHDLAPRTRTGRTHHDNLQTAADAIAAFLAACR
jgi:predicted alpha/beta-hydrolase family hydrolase